tara:strand:- start:81 stop:374 length:294 start_codon:yes stop_codon:yes gene_type:complete
MEKFLSVPVTNEQYQLVSATNVGLIEQASTTTVTVTYKTGGTGSDILTITHATAGAGDETMRDAIQDGVVKILGMKWTEVKLVMDSLPYAVSGIAIA